MKAALAALVVTVVAAGMATPDYDPWRDTISRLASDGQPHAVIVRAALALVALALLLTARRQRAATRSLLTIAAVAGLITAVAPKDLPGTTPSSRASQVHVAAAVIGGAAIVVAMCLARTRAAIAAAAATVLLAVVFQRTWGTGVYGAVERALVAVPLAWCARLR
jgi:MYXO-CTERM domain-containing protein